MTGNEYLRFISNTVMVDKQPEKMKNLDDDDDDENLQF